MLKLYSYITKTPTGSTNKHNPRNSNLNRSPSSDSLSKSARYMGNCRRYINHMGNKCHIHKPTGHQFHNPKPTGNHSNSPRLSTRSLLFNNHRSSMDILLYNNSILYTDSLLCNNRQRLCNLGVYSHTS
jgi:hypothetical protein